MNRDELRVATISGEGGGPADPSETHVCEYDQWMEDFLDENGTSPPGEDRGRAPDGTVKGLGDHQRRRQLG